jgi:endo-1,4-beta-xylanase
MVTFSSLVVALVGIASSLAAPLDESQNTDIAERGAHNFVLGGHNAVRRSGINYNQDYTTGGDVVYTHSNTGFAVNWSNPEDFVVRSHDSILFKFSDNNIFVRSG